MHQITPFHQAMYILFFQRWIKYFKLKPKWKLKSGPELELKSGLKSDLGLKSELKLGLGLKSGSGLETTLASLALRCVLGRISTLPKPNIIVFDEILGKVANINLDYVKIFFDTF